MHAVIASHPSEQSLTMSVVARYVKMVRALGHDAIIRDLYRMDFDPVLKDWERPVSDRHTIATDVADELKVLKGVDVFVLVYPIWFGTPPAMLKGYIERVLGSGFSYLSVRDRAPNELLAGKLLVSLTLSGTSKAWLHEQGTLISLRNVVDEYLKHAFSFRDTMHFHIDRVREAMAPRFGEEILLEVDDYAREVCGCFDR
jgi:NAD(P)H dehydrogenase (quinone)